MNVNGKTRVLGVFGFPVSHSRSPLMQNKAIQLLGLDWVYLPFAVDPKNIGPAISAVRALNLVGVNVTVPLKELVVPHLDWVDPVALKINSVNTIVNSNGELHGYSTDGPGLLWDLEDKSALPRRGETVLVLGAGGSARAVVWAFVQAGIRVLLSNRTQGRAEQVISDLEVDADIISWCGEDLLAAASSVSLVVNTTTLGMENAGDAVSIIPSKFFNSRSVVYDLVYSPPVTPLMKAVSDAGGRAYNGLGMLVRQGAVSISLWTGVAKERIPVSEMEKALFEG